MPTIISRGERIIVVEEGADFSGVHEGVRVDARHHPEKPGHNVAVFGGVKDKHIGSFTRGRPADLRSRGSNSIVLVGEWVTEGDLQGLTNEEQA